MVADVPSARLLKLHAPKCKMLEIPGAADYVEDVVGDLDRMQAVGTLAADGTRDLALLMFSQGLWGWEMGNEDDERCGNDLPMRIYVCPHAFWTIWVEVG